METKRGSFTGGIGFVIAAASSAIGLGNLWRFPYLAAQYGGGIFILVYIILALTFGFTLMITEIAIGRKTGKSPLIAYGEISKKFKFLGYLAVLVPVIILPYYCVIGGWVIKYITVYLTGKHIEAGANGGVDYFLGFAGDTVSPLVFFLIFLTLTMIIVLAGVEKGIEKVSKLLMPILLFLMIAIAIYVVTLPGALDGVKYYLKPDFTKFSFKTVCGAMGQLFYSMSLAMGIMITYGSYMKKDVSVNKSVAQIEIFDTLVAFLAGMMIIPALYAAGGEEALTSKGVGLMFMSLPSTFADMASARIIGAVFFILVLFAALTSSVSVMEAIVSCLMDKFNIKRTKACIGVFVVALIMGVPSSLGFGVLSHIKPLGLDDILTFFDYISNSVLMPIVAFATCIMIGWVVGTKVVKEEVQVGGYKFKREKMYEIMIKYIAPVILVGILIAYTLDAFGIVKM